jgi:hypothetical protein
VAAAGPVLPPNSSKQKKKKETIPFMILFFHHKGKSLPADRLSSIIGQNCNTGFCLKQSLAKEMELS